MSEVQIHLRLTLRWWVRPYLFALYSFAVMTGSFPDQDKLARLISRHGFKFRVIS